MRCKNTTEKQPWFYIFVPLLRQAPRSTRFQKMCTQKEIKSTSQRSALLFIPRRFSNLIARMGFDCTYQISCAASYALSRISRAECNLKLYTRVTLLTHINISAFGCTISHRSAFSASLRTQKGKHAVWDVIRFFYSKIARSEKYICMYFVNSQFVSSLLSYWQRL